MTMELRHEADASRYSFWVDGVQVGLTDYHEHGGVIDIVHTEIDPAQRGRGLGADMVRMVLDDIHETRTEAVRPTCPFVSRFILRNPDYAVLMKPRAELSKA